MGSILRKATLPLILIGLSAACATGCGSNANESDATATKGVAAANAPTSQEEFYKQQVHPRTQQTKASNPAKR